jgi:hypothetical protein
MDTEPERAARAYRLVGEFRNFLENNFKNLTDSETLHLSYSFMHVAFEANNDDTVFDKEEK